MADYQFKYRMKIPCTSIDEIFTDQDKLIEEMKSNFRIGVSMHLEAVKIECPSPDCENCQKLPLTDSYLIEQGGVFDGSTTAGNDFIFQFGKLHEPGSFRLLLDKDFSRFEIYRTESSRSVRLNTRGQFQQFKALRETPIFTGREHEFLNNTWGDYNYLLQDCTGPGCKCHKDQK
jgi:hypothetical protein